MYGRALQRAFAERAMVSLLNHQALGTPRLVSSRHRENHLPSPAFSLSAKEVALVKIPTQFEALFFYVLRLACCTERVMMRLQVKLENTPPSRVASRIHVRELRLPWPLVGQLVKKIGRDACARRKWHMCQTNSPLRPLTTLNSALRNAR